MPNTNERKIIDRLANDSALEMKPYELEELLETELSKPAEEMDMQLVQELVDALEPGEVSAAQQQRAWKKLTRKLAPRPVRKHPLLRGLAAAAVVVLLFGLTLGAASAFRWTFLLKLLQPVAETFGIYMNYSDDAPSGAPAVHQYSISEDENTPVMHDDLSQIPDTYDGYAIKPGWIPEGYAFLRASSFTENSMQKYAIDYQRGEDEMNFIVTIFLDPAAVSSYAYEQTVEKAIDRPIGSRLVTFYRNANDSIQSVSWIDGKAHYFSSGRLSIAEIEKMVESTPSRMSE